MYKRIPRSKLNCTLYRQTPSHSSSSPVICTQFRLHIVLISNNRSKKSLAVLIQQALFYGSFSSSSSTSKSTDTPLRRCIRDCVSSPIGESGQFRVDERTPRGERQPDNEQGEDRRSDSSNRHVLRFNISHTSNDRIRGCSHWQMECHATAEGSREHQVQRMDFNGDCLERRKDY